MNCSCFLETFRGANATKAASLVLESCHSVSDQSRLAGCLAPVLVAWSRLCSSSRPRSAALLEGGPLPAPSTTAHVVSNKEDKKDTQKELRKMAIYLPRSLKRTSRRADGRTERGLLAILPGEQPPVVVVARPSQLIRRRREPLRPPRRRILPEAAQAAPLDGGEGISGPHRRGEPDLAVAHEAGLALDILRRPAPITPNRRPSQPIVG